MSVLRDRDFRSLFAGTAASLFGDRLSAVALAFGVLDAGGGAGGLGAVLAARAASTALLLLAGGVWADRLPRKQLMVGGDLLRAGAQAMTCALLVTGNASIWSLLVLQLIYGIGTAAFNPAATGLVRTIVSPERLQEANGLLGLARGGSGVIGPLCAGALVVIVGPGATIGFDAVTFVISAACLLTLDASGDTGHASTSSMLQELRQGWREFTSRSWLWCSVACFGVINMVGFGAYFVLGPLVAKRDLGGAGAWGIILAGANAGALVGGFAALRVRLRRPLLWGFITFGPAFFVLLALLALGAPVALAAAGAAIGQGAGTFTNAVWETVLQQNVDDTVIARVSSYDWLVSVVLQPIGFATIGPLAAVFGLAPTLWGAAGVVLAAVAITAAVPGVRRLTSQEAATVL